MIIRCFSDFDCPFINRRADGATLTTINFVDRNTLKYYNIHQHKYGGEYERTYKLIFLGLTASVLFLTGCSNGTKVETEKVTETVTEAVTRASEDE